ncbi:MAG: glycoside hydrolase family 43 protein [Caldilineaceae bacterium]
MALKKRTLQLALILALCLAGACSVQLQPGATLPFSPLITPAASAPTVYDNPVYGFDFPDPYVLRVGEQYYAFSTNVGDVHIPTLHAPNLTDWTFVGDALPQLPTWAEQTTGLTWAPGVLQRGDSYVLYYVTRDRASNRQCISLATSTEPAGPYLDHSATPFVCQTALGGSIDPYPFVDQDGMAYLLWKNDGNCCGLPVGLWIQALSDDGLSLQGEPTELIERDLLWELPLIENPALWEHEGAYYLFYSANWWESRYYAVGYAVCETITGPCVKPLTVPLFKMTASVLGPGGEALFTDTEGNLWMVYHAWTAPYTAYPAGARRMYIDPVTFVDDQPVIRGPTHEPQPLP